MTLVSEKKGILSSDRVRLIRYYLANQKNDVNYLMKQQVS